MRQVSLLLLAFALGACDAFDAGLCSDDTCEWTAREWAALQSLVMSKAPPADPSNVYSLNPEAALLGQRLFYDTAFSGVSRGRDALERPSLAARAPDGQPIKVSCASCHDAAAAGSDLSSPLRTVSVGAGTTDVNALPTFNAAYHKIFFWNGRVDSLWALNAVVAESKTTMNGNRLALAHQVATRYRESFSAIFTNLPAGWDVRVRQLPIEGKPGDPRFDNLSPTDRDLVTTLLVNWSKAIAAYEQLLITPSSAFDRFVNEGPKSTWLSPQAREGARLFVGKAACIDCHNGPLLSDDDFHNVGVPQTSVAVPTVLDCSAGSVCDCSDPGSNCLPWGALDGLRKLNTNKFLRDSAWSDSPSDLQQDAYRKRMLVPELKGAWRTPSLRNVALTAPYMHNGVFATLQDVMWHYNTGGEGQGGDRVGAAAASLKPLWLTPEEVASLQAFLVSLTGDPPASALLTGEVGP